MKLVYLVYSKKTGKFQYANMAIGGAHFVKEDIASLIKEKLPAKLSAKKAYAAHIQRAGKTYSYVVKVTA
jgi:hypothetical protein